MRTQTHFRLSLLQPEIHLRSQAILTDEREIRTLLPRVFLNVFAWFLLPKISAVVLLPRSSIQFRRQVASLAIEQRHPRRVRQVIKNNIAAGLFQVICTMLLNNLGAEFEGTALELRRRLEEKEY